MNSAADLTTKVSKLVIWTLGQQEGYTNSLDPCKWYARMNDWVDYMLENQDDPEKWCP